MYPRLSQEERDHQRASHVQHGEGECAKCVVCNWSWPCPMIRALDEVKDLVLYRTQYGVNQCALAYVWEVDGHSTDDWNRLVEDSRADIRKRPSHYTHLLNTVLDEVLKADRLTSDNHDMREVLDWLASKIRGDVLICHLGEDGMTTMPKEVLSVLYPMTKIAVT